MQNTRPLESAMLPFLARYMLFYLGINPITVYRAAQTNHRVTNSVEMNFKWQYFHIFQFNQFIKVNLL